MRRSRLAFALAVSGALASSRAGAAPILAAPAAQGPDADLAALAAAYERQQDTFARAESGLNLDTFVKADQRKVVEDFFAQDQDFQTFAGKHPFEVVDGFGEHGDIGNFSGIASVGVAARLLVLRRDGGSDAEIARARDAAVRAARTWHVFATIGGPGVVARGVRRVAPEPGEPALPGTPPALVALRDASGSALPAKKEPTWRAPVAPGFDGWIWIDDTSKDQVSGYALGAAWLWDALHDDPAAPKDVVSALAADLAAFAKALMVVAPERGVDLSVRDADGRLTTFGDLNARLLGTDAPIAEDSPLRNGFNAALALGIVRAAYHASGDPDVGRFYYEELVGRRDYPKNAADNASLVYTGASTNYSNVNMLAIALLSIARTETDPYVRGRLEETLAKFWDSGDDRSASHVAQPWFDVIVGAYARAPAPDVADRMRASLAGYPPPPTFERDRVNCDAQEIAARSCLAIDGVTRIELLAAAGHGGGVVAKDVVPLSVRPDTNFAWRSDPHDVNGDASNLLDPRGDWLAAYWLGRLFDRDPKKNVSPSARAPLPYTLAAPGAGDDGADAGAPAPAPSSSDGGCACTVRASREGSTLAVALAGAAAFGLALSRRRRR